MSALVALGPLIRDRRCCHPIRRLNMGCVESSFQQPLILPRDMESIKRTKQPDLFMSLKRDLAIVSCYSIIHVFKISFYLFIYIYI